MDAQLGQQRPNRALPTLKLIKIVRFMLVYMVVLLLHTIKSNLGNGVKPAYCLFVLLHTMLHRWAYSPDGSMRKGVGPPFK